MLRLLAPLPLALIAFGSSASAQCTQDMIIADDWDFGDLFGVTVAVDEGTMIVGSALEDEAAFDAGSLYVYTWDGLAWQFEIKLTADDSGPGDLFGLSAAIDGTRIVVGAIQHDAAGPDAGAAYIFDKDPIAGWVQTAKLLPSQLTAADAFGFHVDISGNTVAVSAPEDTPNGMTSGTVYVFEETNKGWGIQAMLSPDTTIAGSGFGQSVALQGDTLVVGSPGDTVGGLQAAGAVYVFERSGGAWGQTQRVTAPDGDVADIFGFHVDLDGDRFAASAPLSDEGAGDGGAAYVFVKTQMGWQQEAKVVPSAVGAEDQTGIWLALDGALLVLGAPGHDLGATDAGAAYLFERTAGSWIETAELLPPDPNFEDSFGARVALDGNQLVVSAPLDDVLNPDVGSIWIYSVDSLGGATMSNYCIALLNSSGESAEITALGSLSVSSNDMTLFANSHIGFTPGVFFSGTSPAQHPFGNGYMCVGLFSPGLIRLAPPAQAQFTGNATLALDFTDMPSGGEITGGSTWYFQYWYRDANGGGSGYNLTDGLEITFCP